VLGNGAVLPEIAHPHPSNDSRTLHPAIRTISCFLF
jgi:hypothetical protein